MEEISKSKKKFEKFSVEKDFLEINYLKIEEVLEKQKKKFSQIIFDTNFLFVPFTFKIDLISEIEKLVGANFNLYIYEGTLNELKNLEKKKTKNKAFLPLIFTMLKKYNFKVIKSNENYIDKQILAGDKKIFIATNDKKLRLELKKNNFKIIFIRAKSYLEFF